MQRLYTYLIQLDEDVDESEINAASPLQVTVEPINSGATCLTVCTDQSGLVGLLRYLHGLGFVFLALSRAAVLDCTLAAAPKKTSSITDIAAWSDDQDNTGQLARIKTYPPAS